MIFGLMGGIEEPAFSISLDRHEADLPYEIREYGTRYAIETYYGEGASDNAPFMRLAGYIGVGSSPKNDGGRAIPMTAPVSMHQDTASSGGQTIAMTAPVAMYDERGSGSTTRKKMQFILPSAFDAMDKIPKPLDPRVRVVQLPPSRGAVYRYSGRSGGEHARGKAKLLADQLRSDGLTDLDSKKAIDTHQFWGYNPPFTLPPLRRNEVWIELSAEQVEALSNIFSHRKASSSRSCCSYSSR